MTKQLQLSGFYMESHVDGDTERSAVLSPCQQYRYRLTRRWADGRMVVWIGLNPSTADASSDDQTIRKMIGFAKRWGCGGIEVVNLYALRTTDPDGLWQDRDPVGQDNDRYLRQALLRDRGSLSVACWGDLGSEGTYRYGAIWGALKCLGKTKGGCPRHPARLAYSTPLEDFRL